MAYYLDTSALVKLVVEEDESAELRQWIALAESPLVTSDLSRTELVRAARRVAPSFAVEAKLVLDSLLVLTLSAATFDVAGRLGPDALRSLDAIHVASALELGDDLEGIVTYDTRMTDVARANGIVAFGPRRP
jgi:predicted nucleic acid-binding protein